ncbi:hypothetical protein [uncultured Algoriphagus sp.]|uniref:hypothetical protein n=1 Tax=uncultured Algoriphagus sp. TaxID=417365 RepID=UPI0025874FF8|nr:hypothetical protein [uncultured Algoriphagus sp.]
MFRIADSLDKILLDIQTSDDELIVLSNYFTSKNDPVRGIRQKNDNFAYIASWYESIHDLGLRGIVFYDALSADFLRMYNSKRVTFVRCQLGIYSLNDERFFIFKEFLAKIQKEIFVITSDINDVVFNKDPLPLLKADSEKLFLGRGDRRSWKSGTWTLKAIKAFHEKYRGKLPPSIFYFPVLNPGTLGGKRSNILTLFEKMCAIFESLGDDGNYDMQAFNLVMMRDYVPFSMRTDVLLPFSLAYWYHYLSYRIQRKIEGKYRKEKYDLIDVEESIVNNDLIYAGHPFVSMFNWFEKKGESKAYLIHK